MIQNNMMGCLMLCVIAYVLQITALMTKHWMKSKVMFEISPAPEGGPGSYQLDSYAGLWKTCIKNDTKTSCSNTEDNIESGEKNSLKAVKVFAITGCILGLLAIIGCFTLSLKTISILLIIGGISSVLSSAVYYNKFVKDSTQIQKGDGNTQTITMKPKIDYSFYMNTVGGLMALVMGGMTLYKGKRMV